MKIYLSSSWKNRKRVHRFAEQLEGEGFNVYDFTNPKCRKGSEIPPEQFPEQFDPEKHIYKEYLESVPEWRQAVFENKAAIENCDLIVLMLPSGLDSHADAFYGLGLGKRLIICGQPNERTPTHLWAEGIFLSDAAAFAYIIAIDFTEYDKLMDRVKTILKRPYSRLLLPNPNDVSGFSATILEFSGCFAEGKTAKEAIENLEIAAESWLLSVIARGQPIPQPIGNGYDLSEICKAINTRKQDG